MATKIWGPLGWMTLHSISVIYPNNPSEDEKQILQTFLKEFANSISCIYCKQHFTAYLNKYSYIYPDYLDNKRNLFLFIVRAHNDVNNRLDKPIIKTVKECLETLQNNIKNTSPEHFRQQYFNYLVKNWSYDLSAEGYMAKRSALTIYKINNDYFNRMHHDFNLNIEEGETFILLDRSDIRPSPSGIFVKTNVNVGFKLKGGRLQLFH